MKRVKLLRRIPFIFAFSIFCNHADAATPKYPFCPAGYTKQQLIEIFSNLVLAENEKVGFRKKIMPVGHASTRIFGGTAANPYFREARNAARYLFDMYHYSWFDAKVEKAENVSYLGQVAKLKGKKLPGQISFFDESDPRVKSIVSGTHRSNYACIYETFDQTSSSSGSVVLSTLHVVSSDAVPADNYSQVWSCVERSYLNYLGYPDADRLNDDQLVALSEDKENHRPTELFGWLVRIALAGSLTTSGDNPKEVIKRLKEIVEERCE